MRFCVAALIAAAATGCSSAASVRLYEESIIEIAKHAIQDKEPWMNQVVFSKPEREAYGSWYVFAWRMPGAEDGFRFIKVDKFGKVIEYVRGAEYRGRIPLIKLPETK